MVVDDPMKSIRRASFLSSYGILEEEEDSNNAVTSRRESLSIDDLEQLEEFIDYTQKTNEGDLEISELDFDASASDGPSRKTSEDSSLSSRTRRERSAAAPIFSGGGTRRRGDKHQRMRQRLGVQNSTSESRRASTGTVGTNGSSINRNSLTIKESFGNMSLEEDLCASLASFTSINSFSSNGATQNVLSEVGNLVFATDAEMENLMYVDDKHPHHLDPGFNSRRGSSAFMSTNASDSSDFSASLPPSATLGTGAFSTVRLAWRQTSDDTKFNEADESLPSNDNFGNNVDHRGIVRVQSKRSDNDSNAPRNPKGELVAVKIIQKSILKQMKTIEMGDKGRMTVHTAYDNIEREIATMKRLQHPNLVRLFEVIDSVESDKIHMILEYVSLGEILSHVENTNRYKRMRFRKRVKGLTKEGHFDEKHAALYFVDIMHGLAYLHRNRICHRDLKPENILLGANGIAKISDFGVSHIFDEELTHASFSLDCLRDEDLDDSVKSLISGNDESSQNGNEDDSPSHLSERESDSALYMSSQFDKGILKKTEGTWCFWSPEMCSTESKSFSGYAADLWAAGVCLYIFTTGTLPFFSMNPYELFKLIAKGKVQYDELGLSDELKNLLGKLLTKDVSMRAGVGDCLHHRFTNQARVARTGELGKKFDSSEEHIILSKNDVKMALSITVPAKGLRTIMSKRISAPAASIASNICPKIGYSDHACIAPVMEYNPKSTSATGTHNSSDTTSTHLNGLPTKKSSNEVGLAKFKMKKNWLWRTRKE